MFETIEIPVWAVWLAGILALIAVLDRILMPTVQWYFHRRLNRTVEVLNERLQLKIPKFKLTDRHVMVDRLVNDPLVVEAILEESRSEETPLAVMERRARKYAREIVPSFSAISYFGFAFRATRWLSTLLYNVHVSYQDETALKDIDAEARVVFVMNHRSNMDYILVTYLSASRSALSYAVGEWARVWPLKQIIRSTGAYFIRRKSRGDLYRRVLARYVQMATEGGVAQAIFPEGGLTRTGALQPAKLGLLNYIVSDFDPATHRDILFVPVGVNYDRVIEDRVMLDAGQGKRVSLFGKLAAIFHAVKWYFWLRFVTKFKRFGHAGVSFGKPVSLVEFLGKSKGRVTDRTIGRLGRELLAKVGDIVPVVPMALVARVFLRNATTGLTLAEIITESQIELGLLRDKGALIGLTDAEMEQGITFGIQMLKRRHILAQSGDKFALIPDQAEIMQYYANSLADVG
ncbi:hypothetical protein BFP76_00595 [Amylibacter kogurei]|uniref:Glycerol-3-phosphate acyltransferase n=1 Tax=Paramylibacter kogurei TaxID=1889778 RepID=A0A2G5K8A1_9RHOB|nr:1-acyl-sn-glycerol-3-phosphate acyltransferase [Amylibacter kogurei]PIB25665.1 hypothetical protein BFP76_00595 [Amylibacter kogurei]